MTYKQHNTIGFTAIGSLLSALGLGAAFSALFFVLSGISFSGPKPTPVLETIQVYLVYAAISGAAIATAFGVAQGVRLLFGGGEGINAGISQVLATLTGVCLGTGLMFWNTIAIGSIDNSSTFALAGLMISPFISGLVAYTAWRGLSKLGSMHVTPEGKNLSLSLARTSAVATLVPFLYLVWLLVRPTL